MLHSSFREGWATQLRRQEGPCDPGGPGARRGELRHIPHHPARKKDRTEQKAGKTGGNFHLRSKWRRGCWGREGRRKLRAGDGKIPAWYQV